MAHQETLLNINVCALYMYTQITLKQTSTLLLQVNIYE